MQTRILLGRYKYFKMHMEKNKIDPNQEFIGVSR